VGRYVEFIVNICLSGRRLTLSVPDSWLNHLMKTDGFLHYLRETKNYCVEKKRQCKMTSEIEE
jgi:hypothetical protein